MSNMYDLLKIFALFILVVSHPSIAADAPFSKDKPIDIVADELTVYQEENKAIFKGNVEAVQADIKLKSSKMTVFYDKAGDASEMASGLSKIVTEGNVKLHLPDRKAAGDKGFYDVSKGVVNLTGNVVLKKDGNILKGSKYVYNVNDRTSSLSNGSGKAKTASGDGKKKERVRAVFTPKKD